MDEIEADLNSGLADYFADELAGLEHLLKRHAAFDAYCEKVEGRPPPGVAPLFPRPGLGES